MVGIQIVCKNATAEDLKKALGKFGDLDVVQQPGHVLIHLDQSDPTDEILLECRKHAYAYLRITAWERGGGLERTGEARCVAGLSGEPLSPITLRDRGERANEKHALFNSRAGLVVATARRENDRCALKVTEHRIAVFVLQPAVEIINTQFSVSEKQEFLDGVGLEYDKYLPLMRAVLRKVDCQYCAHSHYRKVEEVGGE